MGEEKEGKIIIGVPDEIEKRFHTRKEYHDCGRDDVYVYKTSGYLIPRRVVKCIRRLRKELEGVWEIDLDLSYISRN